MGIVDLGPYLIFRPSVLNGALTLGYEDSNGIKKPANGAGWISVAVSAVGTAGWPGAPLVRVPVELHSWLNQLFMDARLGRPGYDGPEPLPIFTNTESQLPDLSLELLVERLPPISTEWHRTQVIRLARQTWQRRSPLRLPVRVQPIGTQADSALNVIRGRPWFARDSDVRKFGLVLSPPLPKAMGMLLEQHVVLCGSATLPAVLKVVANVTLEKRPRLIVALGTSPLPLPEALPDGISLLVVPLKSATEAGEFVKEILYGIIHDCPLSTALKSATLRAGSQLRSPAILASDPLAIHDLRLQDALIGVLDEALRLYVAPSPNIDRLAWSRRIRERKGLSATLTRVNNADATLRSAVDDALKLQADFSRERKGFVPIVKARKALEDARVKRQEFDRYLSTIAVDPRVIVVSKRRQDRRVDVTLLRADSRYVLDPFVRSGERLIAGERYHLRVQIGRRSLASLITEETPAIDPILPDTDPDKGHHLHIALFAMDFGSESATMRKVFLPRYGSSEAVLFQVVAPNESGLARLRIGVYYDLPGETATSAAPSAYWNHLLQLFLLESTVRRPDEVTLPEQTGLRVRLEFSRTSKFSNLDNLSQRKLSIAVNDDPQGTHRLLIKGGAAKQDIRWSEGTVDNALQSMRALLETLTWDDNKKGPRFPENPLQKPEAEFDRWIRELAWAGKKLYDNLWTQANEDFQEVLRQLRDESDVVVQVIRLATNFLFPWAALYDFAVPSNKPNVPVVDVCKGFTRPGYTCEKCLHDCYFPDKSKTFCVYGFWGARQKVEQLLHTPFQKEDAITEIRPMPQTPVRVSVGVTGKIVDQFVSTLQTTLGKESVQNLQSLKEMLDLLWSDKGRPAILLILGHYESPSPEKPRITFAGGEWFQPEDITQKVQDLRKWKSPNPLVILAACESGAASLKSITSFLSAFADARASAVIGTETTVFEGLACRFAKEISIALMQVPFGVSATNSQTLGDAVLNFRRGLLLDFNPLGLVFTPYGDANLHRT